MSMKFPGGRNAPFPFVMAGRLPKQADPAPILGCWDTTFSGRFEGYTVACIFRFTISPKRSIFAWNSSWKGQISCG